MTDKIINTIYSFGAAIVIFGAWGKIEHMDFSSTVLAIGLFTEIGIFCITGIMEWRKTPETQPEKEKEPAGLPGPRKEDLEELAGALRQTNTILRKIFRAE